MVTSLLLNWQYPGYIRWLKGEFKSHYLARSDLSSGIRVQYSARRDWFIDCLAEEFHFNTRASGQGYREGCKVMEASFKSDQLLKGWNEKSPTVFSLVPPSAGMFLWVRTTAPIVHLPVVTFL
jgi:aromatic amino acid aminotransferase I / 2-aminoadipate transaminase